MIRAGDLVMVWRWPHKCPSVTYPVGKPFVVSDVRNTTSFCAKCGEVDQWQPHGYTPEGSAIPLAWLKKIDPPKVNESVEREVTA